MGNSAGNEQKLVIKILGGQTQSQELFDFHSNQNEQLSSQLIFPSLIGYQNGFLAYSQSNTKHQFQSIFKIEKASPHNILITNINSPLNATQNCLWKVLADGEQMELEIGDCIKIGKTKIVFKDIVHSTQKTRDISATMAVPLDRQETERMDITHTQEIQAKVCQGQCRICFDNLETYRNPLLSLCKCSGTVKYIHFDCLRDWTQKNIKRDKSANCTFYSYYDPNVCELCQQPMLNQFKHQGHVYKLYEFQQAQPPYAVFENHEFDNQNKKTKVSVYTVSLLENTKLTVGRHNNSQIILRDISVSRTHCFLTYKSRGLFIQDKNSKFGTLVCPQRRFQFDIQCGLALQYQSKVIKIVEESGFKGFQGCCAGNVNIYSIEINKTGIS